MGKSDKKFKKLNHRMRWLLCLAVAWGFVIASQSWLWCASDSVNFHVGYVSQSPINKGDYVTFSFSHPLIFEGVNTQLTKRVACVAGDVVSVIERDVYCNEHYLGHALEKTGSGQPLEVFAFQGTIPVGKVMLFGDTETSFDSRYWGFKNQDELHKVIPVF